MNKIPLYFNYVGRYPDMLDRAVKSIPEKFEVKVNKNDNPIPFTKCLNHILETEESPIWFFMHYDAEILDSSILDVMIEKLNEGTDNEGRPIASVSSCSLLDLLILIDSEKIKSIGGWDENFKNSYMELDLRQRIYESGLSNPIIYEDINCPIEISHEDSSTLRNITFENNIAHVYNSTFRKDFDYFYNKWSNVWEKPKDCPWTNTEKN